MNLKDSNYQTLYRFNYELKETQDIKTIRSLKNCDIVLLTSLFLNYCFSQLNIMNASIDYLEKVKKYSQLNGSLYLHKINYD